MSKPLRDTPQVGNKPREEDEEEEEQEPRRETEPRNVADGGLKGKAADQAALASPEMPTANANFDGIPFPGVGCNCAPPDTDGEVGLTQYVQLVNQGLQVWNKSNGVSVLGPITIATDLERLRRCLPEQQPWRPGRAVRPARQPLAGQSVRRRVGAHRRMRRRLDQQ